VAIDKEGRKELFKSRSSDMCKSGKREKVIRPKGFEIPSRVVPKRSHQRFMDGNDTEFFPNKKQAVEIPHPKSYTALLKSNVYCENSSTFPSVTGQYSERFFDNEPPRTTNLFGIDTTFGGFSYGGIRKQLEIDLNINEKEVDKYRELYESEQEKRLTLERDLNHCKVNLENIRKPFSQQQQQMRSMEEHLSLFLDKCPELENRTAMENCLEECLVETESFVSDTIRVSNLRSEDIAATHMSMDAAFQPDTSVLKSSANGTWIQ
ncbi:hypothetical protein M8C21_018670, partial [Ambrosia artemisiifolia]